MFYRYSLLYILSVNVLIYSFDLISNVPSLSPLKYIDLPTIASYFLENTALPALVSTVLPTDEQDAVAIFISESACGFLGGIAAQGVSLIDGNKNNKESGLLSAQLSGTYFGISATVRSLAQIAGLSTILVNLFGLVFSIVCTEIIKVRGRSIEPLRTRVGNGPTMYELMKFDKPSMLEIMKFQKEINLDTSKPSSKLRSSNNMASSSVPIVKPYDITQIEIQADLTKWFFVYALLPKSASTTTPIENAMFVGIIAGILSQLVREKKDEELEEINRNKILQRQKELRKLKLQINNEYINNENPYKTYFTLLNKYILSKGIFKNKQQKTLLKSRNNNDNLINNNLNSNNNLRNNNNNQDNINNNNNLIDKPTVKFLKRPSKKSLEDMSDIKLTRFARSAIETAVQVLTYDAARRYVMEITPYLKQVEVQGLPSIFSIISTIYQEYDPILNSSDLLL